MSKARQLADNGAATPNRNMVISGENAADRQDCVDRNTQHLELMVAKDYWKSESMTAINAAIKAGKAFAG